MKYCNGFDIVYLMSSRRWAMHVVRRVWGYVIRGCEWMGVGVWVCFKFIIDWTKHLLTVTRNFLFITYCLYYICCNVTVRQHQVLENLRYGTVHDWLIIQGLTIGSQIINYIWGS